MERREQARLDMLEKKRLEQDERIQKALERAKEPPFKRARSLFDSSHYGRVLIVFVLDCVRRWANRLCSGLSRRSARRRKSQRRRRRQNATFSFASCSPRSYCE